MNRKIVAICLVILMVLSSITALAEYVSYTGKTLPKVTTAIEPNVYLGATNNKTSSTESGRHEVTSIATSSNTQAVKMWRADGASVTGVLWHKVGTYDMGVGSSTMNTGTWYYARARGNTDNTGAVVITGQLDADGGRPKQL